MNILTTICARGGSKGLPNKAILPMNGKPLIQWTVNHALQWGKGKIIVYSDSQNILNACSSVGVIKVLGRDMDDNNPKLNAIRWALEAVEDIHPLMHFDYIVDLDITSPLRTVQDIENAYQLFLDLDVDVLFSVTNARRNPYFNQVKFIRYAYRTVCNPNFASINRRQDAPRVYDLNASIYIYKRNWLINERNISPITDLCSVYQMQDWQAFDIDNEVDFAIVEFLQNRYMKGEINGSERKDNFSSGGIGADRSLYSGALSFQGIGSL